MIPVNFIHPKPDTRYYFPASKIFVISIDEKHNNPFPFSVLGILN
jgi:hypothetical protein